MLSKGFMLSKSFILLVAAMGYGGIVCAAPAAYKPAVTTLSAATDGGSLLNIEARALVPPAVRFFFFISVNLMNASKSLLLSHIACCSLQYAPRTGVSRAAQPPCLRRFKSWKGGPGRQLEIPRPALRNATERSASTQLDWTYTGA